MVPAKMGKVIPLLTPYASPLTHKWIKRLCADGLQGMISKLSDGERKVSLITKASSESIFLPSCSPLPPGKVGESMTRGSKTCTTLTPGGGKLTRSTHAVTWHWGLEPEPVCRAIKMI